MPWLNLLLWTPALGALWVALLPARPGWVARASGAHHGLAFLLALGLTAASAWLPPESWAYSLPWSPETGLTFSLGWDPLSAWMALLTTGLFGLAWSIQPPQAHTRGASAATLLLETAVLGVFLARDWGLFYVFWELTLVPLFWLLSTQGGRKAHRVTLTFVLYTMTGSVGTLLGLVALYEVLPASSLFMPDLARAAGSLPPTLQALFAAALLLGLAVKTPLLPLHGWLPPTYEASPTPLVMILAGVLPKMGSYGLVRLAELLPAGTTLLAPALAALGAAGVLHGALQAWREQDLRRLVAWSSLSHMGLVVVGLSSFTLAGLQGASLLMVAHGLSVAGLFLVLGPLRDAQGGRQINQLGGLLRVAPARSAALLALMLLSAGFPGGVGFVSELHILVGAHGRYGAPILMVLIGGLLWAGAGLRAAGRILLGPPQGVLPEAAPGERRALTALVLASLLLGMAPELALGPLRPQQSALAARTQPNPHAQERQP